MNHIVPVVASSSVSRRGVTIHHSNPFSQTINTNKRRMFNKAGNMSLVNNSTGEVECDSVEFCHVVEVDNEQFIKLYAKGYAALTDLIPAGRKMFEVLCTEMQKNVGKDVVSMAFSKASLITKMSRATYNRGMSDLIDRGFIAAGVMQGEYWVNPAYVFNGNRLSIIKEYRRVSNPQQDCQL